MALRMCDKVDLVKKLNIYFFFHNRKKHCCKILSFLVIKVKMHRPLQKKRAKTIEI